MQFNNFIFGFCTTHILMFISNKPKPMSQILRVPAPSRRLAIGILIGGSLLGLAGLTITGTMIAVAIATPILVFFSPILIPAIAALASITTGFIFSGGFLAATLAVFVMVYRYMTGKRPLVAEQLDYLRMKIASKARDVKEGMIESGDKIQKPNEDLE